MAHQTEARRRVEKIAADLKVPIEDAKVASHLDQDDELHNMREQFLIPRINTPEKDNIYLCGNSLGLQPKNARKYINAHLDEWEQKGVHGHFTGEYPWLTIDESVHKLAAQIVGAKSDEVAIMNSLTANLHLLMVPFYRPTADRHKILIERRAFPSDTYAMESQLQFHGFDSNSLIELGPRPNEHTLRLEDILQTIEKQGDSIALIVFSGVQYYTGQFFDIRSITEAGHRKGCMVGWDLAHAVGNVPLQLHDWNVDFAVWCSYKYLNAGPGAIGGAFVHSRHANQTDRPRFAGWWGHDIHTRFDMNAPFTPIPGAFGYRLSNPCVLSCTSLRANLELVASKGMQPLRQKSLLLTGYLEMLIEKLLSDEVSIITPKDERSRGCQLSLVFRHGKAKQLEHALAQRGVIVDSREPDVIRVAPTPLYNTFADVQTFVSLLKETVHSLMQQKQQQK